MTHRKYSQWWVFALVLLSAAGTMAFAQRRVHRDWSKFPAVVEIDTTEDVFAIGDIHADYERLARLLTGAKIIANVPAAPEKAVWTAGKSVVIFTGDLIDKGPNALGVIALLRSLRDAAARSGGRLIVLMGNHKQKF